MSDGCRPNSSSKINPLVGSSSAGTSFKEVIDVSRSLAAERRIKAKRSPGLAFGGRSSRQADRACNPLAPTPPFRMFDLADLSIFLDSRFLTALPAALAGAGLGAWTAQYIAARNKRIDERLKEVRAANAAVTIAYGITDHFLGMKQQIVKPSVDKFLAERDRFIQADAAPKPPGVTVIAFKVPLDVFRFNWSPASALQDIVFGDLSAPVRPMMVVPILSRTLAMLDTLADDRNVMVRELREAEKAGKEINPWAYYGVPFPSGGADQLYAQTLQHISDYTDDAIKFSEMVGNDLREFALALRDTLPPSVRPLAPKITTMGAWKQTDMLPDPARYKDYEQLYRPIRALGSGRWTASFEALALAQYQDRSEHWIY